MSYGHERRTLALAEGDRNSAIKKRRTLELSMRAGFNKEKKRTEGASG